MATYINQLIRDSDAKLIEMGYRYVVYQLLTNFKNDNEVLMCIVEVTDTLDNVNKFCNDYKMEDPAAELKIWNLETEKWVE